MSSVYGRLGFNSSDPTTNNTITPYSSNVANGMAMVPTLTNSWQTQDIANSDTSGYFQNPVGAVAQSIWNTANTLYATSLGLKSNTSSINLCLQAINSNSHTVSSSAANTYLYTTNRQSNVVDVGSDMSTPHYKTAMGVGKMMSYLTYQTDGVQNNSPIMGNFISITLANTLNPLATSLQVLTANLANSVTNPGYSNVSLSTAQSLQNTISQIANIMIYYPAQDKQFFNNSQNVMADYANVAHFSQIGSTESYLLNNYIGTPKIISRINS